MKIDSLEQTAIAALKGSLQKIPFVQIEPLKAALSPNEESFRIGVRVQNRSRVLLARVMDNGQPRYARLAIYELKDRLRDEPDSYGIFIAPYISAETGKICEEAGIGYLDLAGNCLISFEAVYIRQSGAPNPNIQKRELRSLYSPKSERVLRVLLDEPKRIWRLTDLAQIANVSLGQVANVKKLLLDREWLQVAPSGLNLVNPAALLDEWGGAYTIRRSPVWEYYSPDELPDVETQLAKGCRRLGLAYVLAGFSSAARIAAMVRYQKASAYVKGDITLLIETLGWKPVSSGANVRLLLPYDDGVFYGKKIVAEVEIASPLQTYLDLFGNPGRGQEAAQAVRKELEKTW